MTSFQLNRDDGTSTTIQLAYLIEGGTAEEVEQRAATLAQLETAQALYRLVEATRLTMPIGPAEPAYVFPEEDTPLTKVLAPMNLEEALEYARRAQAFADLVLGSSLIQRFNPSTERNRYRTQAYRHLNRAFTDLGYAIGDLENMIAVVKRGEE